MPNIRTQEAATLSGKSRTTIWRAIKGGRISAIRTDSGDFEIEVAELERVFGPLKPPNPHAPNSPLHIVSPQPNETNNETNMLRIELATMRERAAALERENTMLKEDKDEVRQERNRLLHIIEEQGIQLRLLTDQRAQHQMEQRRRWWQWRRAANKSGS